MPRQKDKSREQRIDMQIVVDCYDEYERAQGWWCYLEDVLQFPFKAKCINKRPVSPLKVGDSVEVTGMADQSECEKEIFVEIKYTDDKLAVPLSQLEPVKANKQTKQAAADWHYWTAMGYRF